MSPRASRPEPVTAVLDTAGQWLPLRMSEVESGLAAAAGLPGPLAGEALITLEAGGKRMRPMLVLLSAGAAAGPAAVRAGIAVELIHMASLVHDDVLDRAPLRRGLPTVFARAGRERATELGDRLFATAFGLLVAGGDSAAVTELSATAVDLARGELLQRRGAWDPGLDEAEYLERCGLKTGRLFEAACRLGLASVTPDQGAAIKQMGRFGHRIGVAFQLLDDVLDIEGPPERTGKARGTDLLDGTVTLPLIDAVGHDPALAALDLRSLDRDSAAAACDRIAATGALGRTRERAITLIEEAKRDLGDLTADPAQRDLLELIADGVVQRYS